MKSSPVYVRCSVCSARINLENKQKHYRKMHRKVPPNERTTYSITQCSHVSESGRACEHNSIDGFYCNQHLYSHGCLYTSSDKSFRCGKDTVPPGKMYCLEHQIPIHKEIIRKSIGQSKHSASRKLNYYEYIVSPEWKERSQRAKDRVGNRCQICNRSSRQVILHAHHRTYARLGHESDLDLTVLCKDCHKLYEDNKKLNKPK